METSSTTSAWNEDLRGSATWNAKTVIAITGHPSSPDASNALIDLSSLSTQKAVITGNSYGVDDLTTKPTFISCSAGQSHSRRPERSRIRTNH